MKSETLLVELLTEELPPKALKRLGEEFGHLIFNGLIQAGLKLIEVPIHWYATPRRLAVQIPEVLPQASDRELPPIKLMPAKIGFDDQGNATPALTKRLGKEGCTLDQATRRADGGTEYVFLLRTAKGRSLVDGLQSVLAQGISDFMGLLMTVDTAVTETRASPATVWMVSRGADGMAWFML